MTTVLLAAATWLTADIAAAATWSTIRGRQKTTAAARRTYTTEALREARARIAVAATAQAVGR